MHVPRGDSNDERFDLGPRAQERHVVPQGWQHVQRPAERGPEQLKKPLRCLKLKARRLLHTRSPHDRCRVAWIIVVILKPPTLRDETPRKAAVRVARLRVVALACLVARAPRRVTVVRAYVIIRRLPVEVLGATEHLLVALAASNLVVVGGGRATPLGGAQSAEKPPATSRWSTPQLLLTPPPAPAPPPRHRGCRCSHHAADAIGNVVSAAQFAQLLLELLESQQEPWRPELGALDELRWAERCPRPPKVDKAWSTAVSSLPLALSLPLPLPSGSRAPAPVRHFGALALPPVGYHPHAPATIFGRWPWLRPSAVAVAGAAAAAAMGGGRWKAQTPKGEGAQPRAAAGASTRGASVHPGRQRGLPSMESLLHGHAECGGARANGAAPAASAAVLSGSSCSRNTVAVRAPSAVAR